MTLIDTTDALENQFGLADRIVDESAIANSVSRFRERGIRLPKFSELADPSSFDHAGAVGDVKAHVVGGRGFADGAHAAALGVGQEAAVIGEFNATGGFDNVGHD